MSDVDDARFYEMVRGRVEHEDGLIVHRLSWLVASQSFLFTAYAISINGLTSPGQSQNPGLRALLSTLPVVGIASSGLIYMGIVAALRAMAWLRGLFAGRQKDEASIGVPPLLTPDVIRLPGLAAPLLLPLLFIGAWTWLLCRA